MTPRARIRLEWLLVTCIAAGLGIAAALGSWFWRIDLGLHDWAQSRNPRTPEPSVLIVAIDEASIQELGRWPWPRSVHAALIDKLTDARVSGVALDLMFSEPSPGDALLAAAMRRNGRVVLPVFQEAVNDIIRGEMRPVTQLAQAAARLGHIQIEIDPDGIARSLYLYEGWQRAQHPQFALALWQTSGGRLPAWLNTAWQTETPADVSAQWVRRQWLRIPFVGPPGSFEQVSYADVLAGRIPSAQLKGRRVLVGATALGLSDVIPVPTSALHRQMPGVEVHANVLTALAQGTAVTLGTTWQQALWAALASVVLMVLLGRLSARWGLIFSLLFIVASLAICLVLLRQWPFWLGPAPTVFACIIAYPLWSLRRLEAMQRYLDHELQILNKEAVQLPVSGFDPIQLRLEIVRRATQAGRDARRMVEETIAHLSVGVIVLQQDQTLQFANDKARALFGVTDNSQLLHALQRVLWPTDVQLNNSLPLPPSNAQQLELTLPNGTPALISLAALGAGASFALNVVIGVADLSEVRAAQTARDDTLRFVSHDLRSPLASLLSLIDEPRKDDDWLPRVRRHAHSALTLADDLFRLARIEALDSTRFELIDLVAICDDACDEVWVQSRDANSPVERRYALEEALVLGNADLLRRALTNLLSNAIKYGTPGKPVELSLSAQANTWHITVRDHGPGIPAAEQGQLFQRFGRLPGALARGIPGNGLGLVMVRTVAERHGGTVTYETPEGGGSCFRYQLPQVAEANIAL